MDHCVHAVRHVDQAAEAAEAQHDEREAGGEHHRSLPGQLADPAEQPRSAAQPSRDLDEALIVKIVSSVGTETSAVSIICRNLKPVPCSGSMNR